MAQELELIDDAKPSAPQRAITAPATPATLLTIAMQNGASMEQLERLIALHERHEANEARKAFHEDMAGFKAEPLTIFKDKHVKFTTQKGVTEYDHATLGNVVKTIIAAMGRHNLSHSWSTDHLEGGRIKVTCKVTHKLGHSESVSLEAMRDDSGGKNNIQALGSTISYLQRYTLLAITGLATEDQDDDAGGSGGAEDDPMLTGFRNAAMDGTAALRAHYNKTLPDDDWWVKNSKALKEAAKKADAEVTQ